MAEFCKDCFIESLMTTNEKTKLNNNEIKLSVSDDYEFCEGCMDCTNYVVAVEEV